MLLGFHGYKTKHASECIMRKHFIVVAKHDKREKPLALIFSPLRFTGSHSSGTSSIIREFRENETRTNPICLGKEPSEEVIAS